MPGRVNVLKTNMHLGFENDNYMINGKLAKKKSCGNLSSWCLNTLNVFSFVIMTLLGFRYFSKLDCYN